MDNPEKTEGVIKNGQSRETENIGCTRYRTKTNKAKNTTQKTKKMSNTDSTRETFTSCRHRIRDVRFYYLHKIVSNVHFSTKYWRFENYSMPLRDWHDKSIGDRHGLHGSRSFSLSCAADHDSSQCIESASVLHSKRNGLAILWNCSVLGWFLPSTLFLIFRRMTSTFHKHSRRNSSHIKNSTLNRDVLKWNTYVCICPLNSYTHITYFSCTKSCGITPLPLKNGEHLHRKLKIEQYEPH